MLRMWGEVSEVPTVATSERCVVGVDRLLMASLDATIQSEFRLGLESPRASKGPGRLR
jgi:hypothetical protein